MSARAVAEVTIKYADGTIETIRTPNGFHRVNRNNTPRETDYRNVWNDHEIRWSDRQKGDG